MVPDLLGLARNLILDSGNPIAAGVCGSLAVVCLIHCARLFFESVLRSSIMAAFGASMSLLAVYYALGARDENLAALSGGFGLLGGLLVLTFAEPPGRVRFGLGVLAGALLATLIAVGNIHWLPPFDWKAPLLVLDSMAISILGLLMVYRGVLTASPARTWGQGARAWFSLTVWLYASLEASFAAWKLFHLGEGMAVTFAIAFTAAKLGLYPFVIAAVRARTVTCLGLRRVAAELPYTPSFRVRGSGLDEARVRGIEFWRANAIK